MLTQAIPSYVIRREAQLLISYADSPIVGEPAPVGVLLTPAG